MLFILQIVCGKTTVMSALDTFQDESLSLMRILKLAKYRLKSQVEKDEGLSGKGQSPRVENDEGPSGKG